VSPHELAGDQGSRKPSQAQYSDREGIRRRRHGFGR
jgi:hypothetical protein